MAKRIIPHTLVDGEYIPHDAAAINDGTERIDTERVIKIEDEITDQKSRTSPLKHGLNVVDSDQASVADLVIEGRTLVNLVPYSNNRYELSAIEGIAEQLGSSWRFTRKDSDGHIQGRPAPISNDYKIKTGKNYIAIGTLEVVKYGGETTSIGVPTPPRITIRPRETVSTSLYSGSNADTTPGSVSTSYVLFKADEDQQVFIQAEILRANANDQFILHNVSLYELTEEEYNTSLTLSSEEISAKYPYVDGIRHTQNPSVVKTGKNLLPPFSEWDYIHSRAEILSPYSLKLIAPEPGYNQGAHIIVPALPNTDYTLSVTGYNKARIYVFSNVVVNGSSIFGVKYVENGERGVFQFKSSPNTYQLIIYFDKDSKDSGEFIFENPQLELDIKATSFQQQNNDYLLFDATLASSLDGAVRDSVYKKNGKYVVRKHLVKDYLIDGNVNDVAVSQRTEEYTEITIRDLTDQLEFSSGGKHVLVDYYGVNYPQVSGQSDQPLSGTFVLGVSSCWIRIPNSYSGWTESPTLSQIRDFLSQKPFKLTYQLRHPIEQELETEGAISLHRGSNLLTLSSGLILNERIEPKRYNAANNAWYGINYIGSTETAHSPLQKEVRRIVDIKADGQSVYHLFQSTSKGDLQNEVAYGLDYARIREADFDPEASYTVTYFPLDNRTPPIEKSSITYQTSVSSSLNKTVEKLTDVETSVSVQANQLVELLARLRALDS